MFPHNEIYFEISHPKEDYTNIDLEEKKKKIVQLQNEISELLKQKPTTVKRQSYQSYVIAEIVDSPSVLDNMIKVGEQFKKELL